MEDGKCQRDVENNSHESWANSHVEPHDPLLLVNLTEAVHEAVKLSCIIALHFSLDYVHWIVRHSRAKSGKGTRHQVHNYFVGDVV